MILCIISAVVPSKKDFYIQVCVAVTPYIFGCSSIFSKISISLTSTFARSFISIHSKVPLYAAVLTE